MALSRAIPNVRVALAPRGRVRQRSERVSAGFLYDVVRSATPAHGWQVLQARVSMSALASLGRRTRPFATSLNTTYSSRGGGDRIEKPQRRHTLHAQRSHPATAVRRHQTITSTKASRVTLRDSQRAVKSGSQTVNRTMLGLNAPSIAPITVENWQADRMSEVQSQYELAVVREASALMGADRPSAMAPSWPDHSAWSSHRADARGRSPQADSQVGATHSTNLATLHVDGTELGRWTLQHLTRVMNRPAMGITSIDPRSVTPRARISPF